MKKMQMHRLSLLLSAGTCVTVAACSFMAPQRDLTQYFVLSPTVPSSSSAASAASTARLSIGVGPIRFPGYLKQPWVVTRITSNRLSVSDEKRWGEPLDRNFESVLCQNLSQILGTGKITDYPWYADNHINYQVEVWVERFEATEDGRSWLTAIWTIEDGQDGRELASGQSLTTASVLDGDTAGSVALSQNLGEMSRQIAERILELNAIPKLSPPPTSKAS
jgi:uncharacterized lipoprotein YmbA